MTAVERGYNIYQANCARCHGAQGEGGIGPILNDQMKLFTHLNEQYLRNVLYAGGRYVCGNPDSLMPVWDSENGGPLNYRQIDELIAFLRATNEHEYVVKNPSTLEPIIDPATGDPETFTGWRDPNFKPAPEATPVPDCWTDAFASPAPSGSPGASGSPSPSGSPGASSPGSVVLRVAAANIAFNPTKLDDAPAGAAVRDRVRQPGPRNPPQRGDHRSAPAGRSSRARSSTGRPVAPTRCPPSRPATTRSCARCT